MSSERWRRVEELFSAALERTAGERSRFLSAACDGDSALQASVEALLDSHHEAGGFLASDSGSEAEVAVTCLGAGAQIGPYRLLSKLGEGGMSTVFLAQRADGSFDRHVALKLVRRGMESDETLRRLRQERQILANLEHPKIARLYDGGHSSEGLPYFVLEWVDGQAIDRYCDHHQLSLEARLDRFLDICDAVAFAHRRMVVHRDLKPSNVLVTEDGEVKLLDFGIAKILATEAQSPAAATAAWIRLLTPQYASPEQVRGEPITTGTDIYSLGCLLFLLLTGREPFQLGGLSLHEVERILSHRAPPKPSDVVLATKESGLTAHQLEALEQRAALRGLRPQALRRQLLGDLDNIALRALDSDLDRRYASVEQLIDDIRRHRNGLPVLAKPPSLSYQLVKLVRRHKMATLAVLALVAAIVGQLASREVYIRSLQEERDRAEAALATQEQVAELTQELFRVAGEGEALTVGQAVDRAARRLDRVVEQQPGLGGDLLDTAGTLFLNLGEASRGGELLGKAAELRRQQFGDGSLEQAETLSTLGVAKAYAGEPSAGLEATREALRVFRLHRQAEHPDLIRPLNNLVLTLCRVEDYQAARIPSEQAYSLASLHLPGDDSRRARAASNHAEVKHATEGLEAALEPYREAMSLSTRAFGAEHPETTTIQSNLALQLRAVSELDEAEQLLRLALAGRIKASGEESPETAAIRRHLGRVLLDADRPDEAEPLLRSARQALRDSSEYGPSYGLTLIATADLATALARLGRANEGEALILIDRDMWQERFEDRLPWAYLQGAWGECLIGKGELEAADKLLKAAHAGLLQRGEDHPDAAESRSRLDKLRRLQEAG